VDGITKAFGGFITYIAEGLKKFWLAVIPAKELLPKEIFTHLTTTTPEWARPLVNDLAHYYLNQAKGVIRSVVETNPYVDTKVQEDVARRLDTILLPSISAIVVSSVAAQLAELIHPLRELRVSETVRNILAALGLYTIVSGAWNVIYTDVFLQPLKYDLNALVRPWLPPQSLVDTMLFQEGIEEREWEEYYRKLGWSDRWISAWRKARYSPPSVWLLYRLMENPNVPEEWYDKVLRYHRIDEEDREVLKEGFRWYSLKDEIYRYRDRLVYYYRKGLIPKTRFIEELDTLPLSKDVIDYVVRTAELERDIELKEDRINAVREGFRKGKLTELEYVSMLREEGIEEPVIQSWLALDKVKRRVELRKTVVSLAEVG